MSLVSWLQSREVWCEAIVVMCSRTAFALSDYYYKYTECCLRKRHRHLSRYSWGTKEPGENR